MPNPRHAPLILLFSLLAAGVSCGRSNSDPATRLFRQLPSGQAIYVYMDIAGMHRSPSLEPLLRGGAMFPERVADLADVAGLDLLSDINIAALSIGPKGTHLAVEGRFDEGSVQRALEAAGATCSDSLRQAPCRLPAAASHPDLSLSMRAEDLLRVSLGSDLGAAPMLIETSLQKLVVQARDRLDQGAMLWATFEPERAEQALLDAPEGFGNLHFFARAIQKAERGYFYVEELPDGELRLTLKANCADSNQADSISKVLTGLNRLAAAALEAGKGEDPPPEVRVLRQARIVNTETTVVAIWILDSPTLRAWRGVG